MSSEFFIGLIIGVIIGLLFGFFSAKHILAKNSISNVVYNQILEENRKLQIDLASRISKEELERGYVVKSWFNEGKEALDKANATLKEKEDLIILLTAESEQKVSKQELEEKYVNLGTYNLVSENLKTLQGESDKDKLTIKELNTLKTELEAENRNIEKRLEEFNAELLRLQTLSKDQFKNLANEIFSEKSKDFAQTNKQSLETLLTPFKENLQTFQTKVETTRKEDIADLTSLKKEIENLQRLNVQLSDDAQKLAGALKSDVKIQGSWGEDRLKYILEAEGLTRYLDYTSQSSYKDEEQEVNRKPDYILNLPDGKHIIVDSKISLNAYVEYFNCTDVENKQECLKRLAKNIVDHIDSLSVKNYQSLTGLNAPDFVCMFMGVEPALSLALTENPDILKRAMEKKVVLMTPTTTMATLKMIKLLWQKENRVKNVEEIFRQCGQLYDKFVLFVEEFQKIGLNLTNASLSYKMAMDRLKDGHRKGDTIIGRFENIKSLEAKTIKSLPQQLLNEVSMLDDLPLTIDIEANENVITEEKVSQED